MQEIRLEDYRPPDYRIGQVSMYFTLYGDHVDVVCRYDYSRTESCVGETPLRLEGRQLELQRFLLDGVALSVDRLVMAADHILVLNPPPQGNLEIHTRLYPARNTSLEGLYQSGANLCTQCEAHGFSRITYFPDRPDVLAVYEVTLEGDATRYPVLLANGNCVGRGDLAGGRHWARWQDPFPKPCYLFALVAGCFDLVESRHWRPSGRELVLQIYVEPGMSSRATFALEALRRAVIWDETANQLECDLDQYMVVAVRDFNMGAMENKGLNIFNSRFVLADAESATDQDYDHVEAVIGHEYFHNWTGNRVTCRDWFQLSLKEGLTVFREQEFCASLGSAGLRRIESVRTLRNQQFPEDAGPLAHPVQPQQYVEVNNFYTATVYEKGAEVVRMLHTLLGHETFQHGFARYIAQQDGKAATIDDWLAAQAAASGRDLAAFRRWYVTAGTPRVTVRDEFDAESGCYTLQFTQHSRSVQPLVIPLCVALISGNGGVERDVLVELVDTETSFQFKGVVSQPVPSLNRGFSAPIHLDYPFSARQLQHIARHETDAFARWEALQRLALLDVTALYEGGEAQHWAAVMADLLSRDVADTALMASCLRPPEAAELFAQWQNVDPQRLGTAYERLEKQLACEMGVLWQRLLSQHVSRSQYEYSATERGRRALWAQLLYYAMLTGDAAVPLMAEAAVSGADNMTDRLAAMRALNIRASAGRERASAALYARCEADDLRLDKWFALEASLRHGGKTGVTWSAIDKLLQHPRFDWRNPNRVRAVLGSFTLNQWQNFHADGRHYDHYAQWLLRLDAINPQTAARLAQPLTRGQSLANPWRDSLQESLRALQANVLSPDLGEVVNRALTSP